MTGKLRDMMPLAGGEWLVSFTTRTNPGELFDKLNGKDVDVEIKRASKGRSKDANAMCWALCSDIGRALKPPQSKDEIYRMAIKAVGVYTQVRLPMWDIQTVTRRWTCNGIGWFTEIVDDAGTGHKWVNLYYGTSTYTADEFRNVLDWLIDEAQQMEIPIPLSKKDEEELLERWGRR